MVYESYNWLVQGMDMSRTMILCVRTVQVFPVTGLYINQMVSLSHVVAQTFEM